MDAYIGEIRMFAGSFAPQNWALCNGSMLQISSNQTLYSLLGVTWGGDGQTTFALPDLRGRLPIGQGQGIALTARTLADSGGAEQIALDVSTIPSHTHSFNGSQAAASSASPQGNVYAQNQSGYEGYLVGGVSPVIRPLNSQTIVSAGGNQPHENVMPGLAVNFIICMGGIYPQHS